MNSKRSGLLHSAKIFLTGGAGFVGPRIVGLFIRKYLNIGVFNLGTSTYPRNLQNPLNSMVTCSLLYIFVGRSSRNRRNGFPEKLVSLIIHNIIDEKPSPVHIDDKYSSDLCVQSNEAGFVVRWSEALSAG